MEGAEMRALRWLGSPELPVRRWERAWMIACALAVLVAGVVQI